MVFVLRADSKTIISLPFAATVAIAIAMRLIPVNHQKHYQGKTKICNNTSSFKVKVERREEKKKKQSAKRILNTITGKLVQRKTFKQMKNVEEMNERFL